MAEILTALTALNDTLLCSAAYRAGRGGHVGEALGRCLEPVASICGGGKATDDIVYAPPNARQ